MPRKNVPARTHREGFRVANKDDSIGHNANRVTFLVPSNALKPVFSTFDWGTKTPIRASCSVCHERDANGLLRGSCPAAAAQLPITSTRPPDQYFARTVVHRATYIGDCNPSRPANRESGNQRYADVHRVAKTTCRISRYKDLRLRSRGRGRNDQDQHSKHQLRAGQYV